MGGSGDLISVIKEKGVAQGKGTFFGQPAPAAAK